MKRRVAITGALCLLVGAVVNVLVAWGCAVWGNIGTAVTVASRHLVPEQGEPRGMLRLQRQSGFGTVFMWSWCFYEDADLFIHYSYGAMAVDPRLFVPDPPEQLADRWSRRLVLPWLTKDAPWPPQSLFADDRSIVGRGWPAVSLWCGYTNKRNGPVPVEDHAIVVPNRFFIAAPATTKYPRALPYGPVWSGMAIDSAVYGAFAWIVTAGLGKARRAMRRRRWQCVACGYDLRGLPAGAVCPECGLASTGKREVA